MHIQNFRIGRWFTCTFVRTCTPFFWCSKHPTFISHTFWRFFRFRDTSSSFDASSKRYVITNPPDDFNLLPTDQVSSHLVGWIYVHLEVNWVCPLALSNDLKVLTYFSFMCITFGAIDDPFVRWVRHVPPYPKDSISQSWYDNNGLPTWSGLFDWSDLQADF